MKITAFNPLILSPNQEAVIQLFEALGFTTSHSLKTDVDGFGLNVARMKNEDGFRVDIADVKAVPQDFSLIRMNVDDFDSAYQLLLEHGFKNVYGEKTVDTATSRSAVLISSSGFGINLIQHKK